MSKISDPIARQSWNVRRCFRAAPGGLSLIGHFDRECERALGNGISTVEYLPHDFVAEVELGTGNSRLVRSDAQPHELRCARGRSRRFSKLGDRIQLADTRLLVDAAEHEANRQQQGRTGAAARARRIGSVAQLGVVDELGVRSADVLLRDEIGRAQRQGMIRIGRREELANHRERPRVAAPRLGAAGRVPGDDEGRASLAEITGVRGGPRQSASAQSGTRRSGARGGETPCDRRPIADRRAESRARSLALLNRSGFANDRMPPTTLLNVTSPTGRGD